MNISIRLFDKLELSDSKRVLTEADLHSEQMSKLLAYLITHREMGCAANQLIDEFWNDDSVNQANALKNLVYRLRKCLKQCFPDQEVILTGKSMYQWNTQDISVKVDSEEFERLLQEAQKTEMVQQKILLLEEAVSLYRGRFLSSFSETQSVLFQQIYFHNLYIDAVCELAGIYEERMDYDSMETLLQKAVLIESTEERLHCLLLKAYIGKNRLGMAEKYYHETMQMLEDYMGEETTEEMRGIYRELMKRQHSRETDLKRISQELLSYSETRDSAFYCQYGVFQNIYELEYRRKDRLDYPLALVLISVYADEEEDAGEAARKVNDGMRFLRQALETRLRHGDIFTRYSNTQYLVLLAGCKEENVDIVMDHVMKKYYIIAKRGTAKIQYSAMTQES